MFNCEVCGDATQNYSSYGGLVCSSCRVFFRRQANKPTSRCYYGGHCQITIRTRSFCQTCRLEKCLSMGMDPSRIKKRRIPSDQLFEYSNERNEIQDQTSEIMRAVSDFLTLIPKETSRPKLQVKELSIRHSDMPFTTEEFAFCQRLKEIQASVWKAIPLPMEVMAELIYRTNSKANLVPKTIIENAKHTVVRRYLSFADHMDSFQNLRLENQFVLQTLNLKFLIFVHTAYVAKQMSSMQQQINYAVHATVNDHPTKDKRAPKIHWDKIYSWMAENHQLYPLIQYFQALNLDHVCVLSIILIIMFNAPKDMKGWKEIKVAQDHFKLTLYRYLRSKMSTANAVVKMEEIEHFLGDLLTSQNISQLE